MNTKVVLDKKTIKSNLKCNYKKSIIIFIIFLIIGGIFAGIQVILYQNQKNEQDNAFKEDEISISYHEANASYYEDILNEFIFKESFLNIYLDYYERLDFSAEDKTKISQLKDKLYNYTEGDYQILIDYYKKNLPVKSEFVSDRLASLKNELESVKNENAKLDIELNEVNSNKYNRYYKGDKEKEIFQKKVINEEQINFINYQITYLNNISVNDLKKICNDFDKLLLQNESELNSLIVQFNELNNNLSDNEQYRLERNDGIYNYYKKNINLNNGVSQKDIDCISKKTQ